MGSKKKEPGRTDTERAAEVSPPPASLMEPQEATPPDKVERPSSFAEVVYPPSEAPESSLGARGGGKDTAQGLASVPTEVYPPWAAPELAYRPASGEEGVGGRVIVKEGDTLERLARRIYGRVDEGILIFVQKHNPMVRDIDFIRTGWELHFPPLSAMPE